MTPSLLFWRAAGVVVAVLGALALRWSTVAPWRTSAGEGEIARVRQSWARPERVERAGASPTSCQAA